MFSEFGNAGRTTVRATTTLTLEFPKLALLLPEGGEAAGEVVVAKSVAPNTSGQGGCLHDAILVARPAATPEAASDNS